MPRYDASAAEIVVFTEKDGVLAAMGHDLKLGVTRFELDVERAPPVVTARIDARSLRVLAAVRGGAEDSAALSAADREQIERNIVDSVLLDRGRHGEILFHSSRAEAAPGGGHRVTGELTIRGVTRTVTFETRVEGGSESCELRIHQPDYGIKPFRAPLGVLRVKPDVRVRVRLPAP